MGTSEDRLRVEVNNRKGGWGGGRGERKKEGKKKEKRKEEKRGGRGQVGGCVSYERVHISASNTLLKEQESWDK